MPGAPVPLTVVVCDACVLINFLIVDRLDLLSKNPAYRFVVTEHVTQEVTEPDQNARLRGAIESGDIEQIDLSDPPGLLLFAELRETLGGGEAAAIALAVQQSWAIATDEGGRTRREIEGRLGENRLLTTPGILLDAIRHGTLSIDDADRIKRELEDRRFKMSFKSFADLLSS